MINNHLTITQKVCQPVYLLKQKYQQNVKNMLINIVKTFNIMSKSFHKNSIRKIEDLVNDFKL